MRPIGGSYRAIEARRDWRPGIQRLPLSGTAALLVSFAGILLSVAILLGSNGRPINSWRFQPTVYLSIASTMTNISLSTALVEGVAVAWWNKTMENGTTLADLHRVWIHGKSFWSSLTSGRYFNRVALACILVALTPINGPLLQRASHVRPQGQITYPTLGVRISPQISSSWPTGILTGRDERVKFLTNSFSRVVRDFDNQVAIAFNSTCDSTCNARIRGSGFRASCLDHAVPFNFSETVGQETLIFNLDFSYDVYGGDPAVCVLNLLFKPSAGCLGSYTVRSCNFQVGLMEYPVVIDGKAGTIALQPESTIWDDTVVGSTYNITPESLYSNGSTYGGVYLALSNKFTDTLSMSFEGAVGWSFDQISGETGNTFLRFDNQITGDFNCTGYMEDPTETILQWARELMFRAAIAASNTTTVQHVEVQQLSSETVYESEYIFLALATMVSCIGITSVILVFKDFWRLGRPVTLSPVEVAAAFKAPALRTYDSNATVDEILEHVGRRPIKYGAVPNQSPISGPQQGHSQSTSGNSKMTPIEIMDGSESGVLTADDQPRLRLQLADPSDAGPINRYERYGG